MDNLEYVLVASGLLLVFLVYVLYVFLRGYLKAYLKVRRRDKAERGELTCEFFGKDPYATDELYAEVRCKNKATHYTPNGFFCILHQGVMQRRGSAAYSYPLMWTKKARDI